RARSDTSSDDANVHKEIDELYTEAMHMESYVISTEHRRPRANDIRIEEAVRRAQ
ncbi:9709_t:CDS:2, partial [Dentiscutata heterogama]